MADPARLDELRRQFEENPRRYFAPLAGALRRAGDAEAAATLARTQLAVYPGHLTGHVILGQALLDLGDAAGARGAFERAAELDAGNVVALQQILTIARATGDEAGVAHWTARLVEADPELAAEVAASAPAGAFEPLDLEDFAADDAGAFTAAALDPRLAVDARAARVEGAAPTVTPAEQTPAAAESSPREPAPTAATAEWPVETVAADEDRPSEETADDVQPAAADVASADFAPLDDAFAPLDPVVGLDVPPEDPVPAPMREALADLLDAPEWDAAGAPAGALGTGPGDREDEDAVVPPPAAPFVTETMAGLLLAQGHAAQALDVYERLVAQRPDDERLRAQVADLRGRVEAPAAATTAAESWAEAPTARAFFAGLARQDAPAGDPPAEPPATGTDEAPYEPARDEPTRDEPTRDEPAPDEPASIAGAAAPVAAQAPGPDAESDERAARMWRAAFAPLSPAAEGGAAESPTAGTEAAGGAAAGAAFDDPSFDHFFAGFGDAPPHDSAPAGDFERWAADADEAAARGAGERVPGAVALRAAPADGAPNELTRDEMTPDEAAPAPTPAAPPPDDPDDDLAQFNAWLRGLAE